MRRRRSILFRSTGVFRAGLLGEIKRRPTFAWSCTFVARAAVQAQPHGELVYSIPQTKSAFRQRGRRIAFRSHAHPQSRLFALWESTLTTPAPNWNRLAEIVSDDLPVKSAD